MLFKKSKLGLRLLRQSGRVFREEKKLWLLPLIGRGFFFLILVTISFLVWKIRSGDLYSKLTLGDFLIIYLIVILALWIGNIISTYFNAALISGLKQYEQHQLVSLKIALTQAWSHLWGIFIMILAYFTVGAWAALFRNRSSTTSRFNKLLLGLPWIFASFFVSTLVTDTNRSYFQNLRRSSQLMFDIAGSQPQFNFSFFWISIVLRFISFVPMLIGLQLHQSIWRIFGTVLTFFILLLVAVFFNGVNVTLHYALYQYFAYGKTFKNFQSTDLAESIGREQWLD